MLRLSVLKLGAYGKMYYKYSGYILHKQIIIKKNIIMQFKAR